MLRNFIAARPKRGQDEYWQAIQEKDIVFCTGKSGVGKTFGALNAALAAISNPKSGIRRIIIVRSYVPSITGERLGFLPGDLHSKVTPLTEGIRDNLRELLPKEQDVIDIYNKIEFTTLSFLRGRSLNNCFIIVDEAQNCTFNGDSLKMILTRIGRNSKLVIQGDLDQTDVRAEDSALAATINILRDIEEIVHIDLSHLPTYRNPLVDKILKAYEKWEQQ